MKTNLPAPDSKKPPSTTSSREIDQEKFRQYLRETDQFLREHRFDEAKSRLAQAKIIDPASPYIAAFEARIELFQSNPNLATSPPAPGSGIKGHTEPSSAKVSKQPDHTAASREIIEQKLRQQIELEYKNKFMKELQKAETIAAKILEEERLKIEQQRHLLKNQFDNQVEETQKQLQEDYQRRLNDEVLLAEERLKQQFQKEQSFVETELKTQLSAHYEKQMTELELKLKQDQLTLIESERQSFEVREKERKEQFDRKLLDALRKTETMFREQSKQLQDVEEKNLTERLTAEFQATLEKEREEVKRQHDVQRKSLEQSFSEQQKKLAEESHRQIALQIESIRAKETEKFEQQRVKLRHEIETELQKKFEAQITSEQKRIQKEADEVINKEKERLQSEYDALVGSQNKKIQEIRNQIKTEMEQIFLKRLEHVVEEYDHKMELLGAKIPQSLEEKQTLYRERLRDCYINGQPTEEDAKLLMELKELLELSFDEHLALESDVRLHLYAEYVERKILSGALNIQDSKSLDDIKFKYRISHEESSRLEPYILSSFQRLTMKGRILLADDEPMLLESIGGILSDSGYQVMTSLDVNDALQKLDTNAVDLILSDIKFAPGEADGFQFFKSVQEKPQLRSIPFVFMSSLKDGVFIRSGMQLGVDDYLTKPVDPEMLIAVIEGKLRRRREIQKVE